MDRSGRCAQLFDQAMDVVPRTRTLLRTHLCTVAGDKQVVAVLVLNFLKRQRNGVGFLGRIHNETVSHSRGSSSVSLPFRCPPGYSLLMPWTATPSSEFDRSIRHV
jgi:hypothetical protein